MFSLMCYLRFLCNYEIYNLQFLSFVVSTSESTKQVVILELTVPWEDRIEEAHERKRAKYAGLSSECQNNGWKTRCEPVEVGCRGFAGHSLLRILKLLGVKGLQLKKATANIL